MECACRQGANRCGPAATENMKVNEITGLKPLSDAYELNPKSRYLLLVREPISYESEQFIRLHLRKLGVQAVVISGREVNLLELKPEHHEK